MKKIVLTSLVASSLVMGAGYKIPETSTNSVALSGANIAHVHSADAAYDNPANMIFMENKNHLEANLMYVGTSATEYTQTGSSSSINADEQQFLLPSLHYVSSQLGESGARVGLSIVVPGGLSRTWKDTPAILRAKEFTLEVVEINPTVAFQVSNTVSVAFGLRAVHSSGIVKFVPVPNVASVDMSGNSLDFGYNLALAYHPNENWQVGLTYRSNVNLSEVGTADIVHPNPAVAGSYDATVSIPLPATFNAAVAYTLPSDTTIEFVYEKTYWSAYKNLNFEYTNPVIEATFGTPIPKNWEDTNAYRVGITQVLDTVTLMAGYVYDQTAIPDKTLGFESPGSNTQSVSCGARFKIDENLDVGLSALYSMKEDRTIDAAVANINNVNGTFSNSNVLLVSAGIGYKF